jgi:hypothetical protein
MSNATALRSASKSSASPVCMAAGQQPTFYVSDGRAVRNRENSNETHGCRGLHKQLNFAVSMPIIERASTAYENMRRENVLRNQRVLAEIGLHPAGPSVSTDSPIAATADDRDEEPAAHESLADAQRTEIENALRSRWWSRTAELDVLLALMNVVRSALPEQQRRARVRALTHTQGCRPFTRAHAHARASAASRRASRGQSCAGCAAAIRTASATISARSARRGQDSASQGRVLLPEASACDGASVCMLRIHRT